MSRLMSSWGMDAIEHACTLIKSFEIEPKPLDETVRGYFGNRGVGSSERRIVADIVYDFMRWRRRVEGYLSMAGYTKPNLREKIIALLKLKRMDLAQRTGLDEDVARMKLPQDDGIMPHGFPGGSAAYYSFPDFLYKRFEEDFGNDGAAELAQRLCEPARPIIRVNTLKASREEVAKILRKEGVETSITMNSPYSLGLTKRMDVGSSSAFRDGLFELQDEGSQVVTVLADSGTPGFVLDACAGAGGKTLMLSMLMKGKGRITASDPDSRKLNELSKRARRASATNIETISTAELESAETGKGKFDVVLIDAPCTGTGTIRRSPDLKWRISERTIKERTALQKELLAKYSKWARHGGRVVYVTCSVLAVENERVVEGFLKDKDFEPGDAESLLSNHGVNLENITVRGGFVTLDPRAGTFDGFFAAVLNRR